MTEPLADGEPLAVFVARQRLLIAARLFARCGLGQTGREGRALLLSAWEYNEALEKRESKMFRIQDESGPENNQLPWDRWEDDAIAAGIPHELANLGRAVMRLAHYSPWEEPIKIECGQRDRGEVMLQLARSFPEKVRARWNYLISTDGGKEPA